MSPQRRQERHQSETEEEKVKKGGREKREKKCLCFDIGGMRRNRGIALKDFLIISHSFMRFLFPENQKDITTGTSYCKQDQVEFLLSKPG